VADLLSAVDAVAHEAVLFAAIGLIIGGIDDLLVDLLFLIHLVGHGNRREPNLGTLPPPRSTGRIVVFVAAWDEVAVIGSMLSAALARFDHPDYRIYVGLYPNDRPTIEAATRVACTDARIRLVIGARPGPTTKADNLNSVWRALLADERRNGVTVKAIVLHDAEDVVHPAELRLFDTLIEERTVVQLPVLPLIKPGARLVSGHYADEFAEAHGKALVVRTRIGAAMPLAGTGCAIARSMLERIADERDGNPFDATSLTEDYELGLRIADLGGRALFARVRDENTGMLVAVRAYFPATIATATRQKARWITGIALAGWDRTGWARLPDLADHWMRMRDRRAPIAVLVLATAYVAVAAGAIRALAHLWTDVALHVDPLETRLLAATAALLAWRVGARMICTGRCYGWREALWAVPRVFVGNLIALMAAPRALTRYVAMLLGAPPVWDKTRHEFPVDAEAGR
jgi:adsorption protein B